MAEATAERTELFEHLEKHERALGDLYRAYAQRFPYQQDFWNELAGEEEKHVSWLHALNAATERRDTISNEDRFRVGAIKASVDYLKQLMAEAQTGKVRMINALSIAMDLEQSILERKYFEAVETDSAEVRSALKALEQETRGHLDRVRTAWENAR